MSKTTEIYNAEGIGDEEPWDYLRRNPGDIFGFYEACDRRDLKKICLEWVARRQEMVKKNPDKRALLEVEKRIYYIPPEKGETEGSLGLRPPRMIKKDRDLMDEIYGENIRTNEEARAFYRAMYGEEW